MGTCTHETSTHTPKPMGNFERVCLLRKTGLLHEKLWEPHGPLSPSEVQDSHHESERVVLTDPSLGLLLTLSMNLIHHPEKAPSFHRLPRLAWRQRLGNRLLTKGQKSCKDHPAECRQMFSGAPGRLVKTQVPDAPPEPLVQYVWFLRFPGDADTAAPRTTWRTTGMG